MLKLSGVSASYGSVPAISNVSIEIGEGEAVGLFGANGAGKSTTLRAISGLVKLTERQHHFCRHRSRIAAAAPNPGTGHRPCAGGTPGVSRNDGAGKSRDRRLRAARPRPSARRTLELVYGIFPRLAERRKQLAGTMSGGEQQMLAVGRGLMLKPRLLMLDEPSLGLAPVMTDVTFEKIGEIHKMGTAILLVEQNVSRALSLVQRAYVLESGNVIMHGSSSELANNKQVQAAYLGI